MAIPFHSDIQLNGTLTVGVDDIGHDVKFFGATSGKYLLWDESDNALEFTDNTYLKLGTGADLWLYHDATDSHILNNTGDLYITNTTDDGHIIFKCDDGAGGTTPYITLDGGYSVPYVALEDSTILALGTGKDLLITHDGTNSKIDNMNTGDIKIRQFADDKDIIFQCDNGTGSVTTYFSLDGSLADGTYFYTKWPDNSIIALGSSNDLLLWHDASNSYIRQVGTGDLIIENITDDRDIIFKSDNGSGGTAAYITLDGSTTSVKIEKSTFVTDNTLLGVGDGSDLRMFHNGTNSYIDNYTGDFSIRQRADDKDLIFQCDDGSGGVETYFYLDGSNNFTVSNKYIRFIDNAGVLLGSSTDAQLIHDGTNTIIQNNTGDLFIKNAADDKDIIFQSDDGSGGVEEYFRLDGGTGHTQFPDAKKLTFGSSFDMFIEHDGNNSYISNSVGTFYIRQTLNDGDLVLTCDDGSGGNTAYITLDGSAETVEIAKATNVAAAITTTDYRATNTLYLTSDGDDSGSNPIVFRHGPSGERARITSGGNLLLNTTTDSGYKLDVNGGGVRLSSSNFHVYYGSYTGSWARGYLIQNSDASDQYGVTGEFNNDSFEGLRIGKYVYDNKGIFIEKDGNVGIGTTSPTHKLEVNGNVKAVRVISDTLRDTNENGHLVTTVTNASNTATVVGNTATCNTLTLGVKSSGTVTTAGNLTVSGDLTVSGSTVTVDTTNLNVQDKNITLNYSTGDSSATADGAGITIQDAVNSDTDATILWDATNDEFDFSHGTTFAGKLQVNQQGNGTNNNPSPVAVLSGQNTGAVVKALSLVNSITPASGNGTQIAFHNASNYSPTGTITTIQAGDVVTDSKMEFQIYNSGLQTALTIDHDSNSTFAGTITASGLDINGNADIAGDLTIDGTVTVDTDSGSQPFYITRSGVTNQALSIKVMDDNVRFESIQDESADDYGGFDFRMDSGTTEPDFIIRKGTAAPLFNLRGDGNATFAGDVTVNGGDIYLALSGSTQRAVASTGTNSLQVGDAGVQMIRFKNAAGNALDIAADGNATFTGDVSVDKIKGSTYSSNSFLDFDYDETASINNTTLASIGRVNYIADTNGNDEATAVAHAFMTGTTDIDTATSLLTILNNGNATFARDVSVSGDLTMSGHKIVKFASTTYGAFDSEDFFRIKFRDNGGTHNDVGIGMTDSDTLGFNTGAGGSFEFNDGTNGNVLTISNGQATFDGEVEAASLDINGSADISGTLTSGAHTINSLTDSILTLNQTGTDTGWSYIDFKTSGTRNWYIGQDDNKNFDIYNDNIDSLGLSIDYTNNAVSLGGNTTVSGSITVGTDDTGHDVIFYGATSGRYLHWDESQDRLELRDNVQIAWGSGIDFTIVHDGTDSKITNSTGDLVIRNLADDKDIIFQSDDGAGDVATYFFLDGSGTSELTTTFPDNSKAGFGNGNDLRLWHDGGTSYINNYTGDFRLYQHVDDGDMIFYCDDGSGGATPYLRLDGSTKTVDVDVPIEINDQMLLGSKQAYTLPAQGTRMRALQIADHTSCRVYLDSSENSYNQPIVLDIFYRAQTTTSKPQIVRSESYEWHTHSNDIIFTSDQAGTAGADSYIYFEKVAYSTGRNVKIRKIEVFKGTVTVLDGSTTDTNGGTDEAIVSTFAELNLGDNDYLRIGDGNDLQIYHNGSHSYIDGQSGAGSLYIRPGSGGTVQIEDNSGNDMITAAGSGSVNLYYNAVKKFETKSDGVDITGELQADSLDIDGNANIAGNLTMNGTINMSNYNITGVNALSFNDPGPSEGVTWSNTKIFESPNDLTTNTAGNLQLVYNNTRRLTVDSSGIDVNGDANVSGTLTAGSLDINGTANISGALTLEGTTDQILILKVTDDGPVYHSYYRGSDRHAYVGFGGGGDTFSIVNEETDGDIVLRVGADTYFYLDGGNNNIKFEKDANWIDNEKAIFGSGSDLQIQHDGSHSYISQGGTGNLYIQQNTNDQDLVLQCDDGSGGTTAYLTLDGSAGNTKVYKNMLFDDSIQLQLGSGSDLRLYHDGSDSYVRGYNQDLIIMQDTADKDIKFKADDGVGGSTEYFRLDGALGYSIANKHILFEDSVKARFGSSADLEIQHDGSNSYIHHNGTGSLYMKADTGNIEIINYTNDADIIFQSDNGSGGVTPYFRVDGSVTQTIFEQNVRFLDTIELRLGTSNDLKLYHDGSNSYIHNDTGDLYIENDATDGDIIFRSDNGSGGLASYMSIDGGGTDINFFKDSHHIDNVKAKFGSDSSGDLTIYHDGSNSFIDNSTGIFRITQSVVDGDLVLRADNGSGSPTPYITLDGSEEKVVVNKPSQRTFTKSGTTDGDANGDIVYFGGTTSMEVGAIYFFNSSGNWQLADADAESTSYGMLGVALGASSDTDGVLIRGFVTLNHDPGTISNVLFLSTTAGLATATAPSGNGDIVRVIGYCLDSTNGQIYFNPDGTYVEVTA